MNYSATIPAMRRLVGGKLLRCGYTTGVCAAGAAKAAALMLVRGELLDEVTIETPAGLPLQLGVVDPRLDEGWASCAVRKDGGDDPDATNGALIYARVERAGFGLVIDGGEGIGRVGKPGLDQPVGAAAINSVPRRMIADAVRAAVGREDRDGWRVVISCPTGGSIAAKTFNPRLGITGGISILGTTGIVEPMSNTAIIETMAREISILAASGVKDLLVVIGNYGETFAREQLGLDNLGLDESVASGTDRLVPGGAQRVDLLGSGEKQAGGLLTDDNAANARPEGDATRETGNLPASFPQKCPISNPFQSGTHWESREKRNSAQMSEVQPPGEARYGVVKSSNFIGDAISQAAEHGFERVLVVGHLGKLVKVGIGMLNTHSSVGDGRMETLIACALQAGANVEVLRRLQESVSTDAALLVLLQAELLTATTRVLGRRIQATFDQRTPDTLRLEWISFAKLGGSFSAVVGSARSGELVGYWHDGLSALDSTASTRSVAGGGKEGHS
ncbi:MAG: cobalt-precorrin-5B (C(1))-methyltransferase CbiD [Propionibacteriaceae bacterium]|jgi:cobalt-precorrin-5B (C1)-methyltransferase|nr:cobalt-precorrin-5B (C(1))-methyltransferase CbiD [Propionibacteriaceae bacterium]